MASRRLQLIFTLFLSVLICRADVSETAKKLAGTTAQTWIAQRIEMVMSAGKRCKKGESWRFSANHSVEIRRCVEGNLVVQQETWVLEQESALDTVLIVAPARYYVTFYTKRDGTYMQLKTAVDSKADERINTEFRLSDE